MESYRDYKLKAKNFWRDNEKLIIMIASAFIIGALIAGVNYWDYQNRLHKYDFSGKKSITNDHSANFTFSLERPSVAQGTKLSIEVSGNAQSIPLVVSLNGEKLSDLSSNSKTFDVPTSQLKEQNTVVIKRKDIGFKEQNLIAASVTSTSSFRQLMFVLLNLGSLLLMAAPLMYIKYTQYQRRKKMEEKFPEFLRDIVEGTRAGMSLPKAIQNTETGSYGPLDQKIEKMNAQLDWGIPFGKVMKNFGRDTGSDVIRRSVDTIIQAYESGGNIQDVLESVGDNIRTIKKLKEERESQLYGEMITGYIVFFIFIGILVALTNFLLPNLASAQKSLGGSGSFAAFGGGGGGGNLQENIRLYKSWFKRLVYIQAVFSGLIIGKLSEGELKAGFKHMAILFAAGYLAITFFL
ncbi:MAG: type II secretion system F family protein [Candidatus Nanohaloarchaea archaeon]